MKRSGALEVKDGKYIIDFRKLSKDTKLRTQEVNYILNREGKRAQQRIAELKKQFYTKGGKYYGRRSWVYEKYKSYSRGVAGLSLRQREQKVRIALEILSLQESTVIGAMRKEWRAYEKYKENNREGRNFTIDEWRGTVNLMGVIEQSVIDGQYDSDIVQAYASYLRKNKISGINITYADAVKWFENNLESFDTGLDDGFNSDDWL